MNEKPVMEELDADSGIQGALLFAAQRATRRDAQRSPQAFAAAGGIGRDDVVEIGWTICR